MLLQQTTLMGAPEDSQRVPVVLAVRVWPTCAVPVLVLHLSRDGVHILVVHPHTFLGGPKGSVVKQLLQVDGEVFGVVVA